MSTNQTSNHRSPTDLACDAMINEGGAVHQPSMHDSEAVLQRLHQSSAQGWFEIFRSPITVFCASFATSLLIALLRRQPDKQT